MADIGGFGLRGAARRADFFLGGDLRAVVRCAFFAAALFFEALFFELFFEDDLRADFLALCFFAALFFAGLRLVVAFTMIEFPLLICRRGFLCRQKASIA
jgi:hypothetical protein